MKDLSPCTTSRREAMRNGFRQQISNKELSRNWGLIRQWDCKSVVWKWHMQRSMAGCGSGAGRVR